MNRSVIIYFGVFCLSTFFSYKAEKKNKISYVIVIIAILTFLSGFRNYTVGIDTAQYVDKFNSISLGHTDYAYGLEYSFRFICKILLSINNSPTFLFLVFALLTNWLIIMRFWELKKLSSFTMMIICYYCTFYFYSFNIMRQMCGIAIIFWSTRFLEKGNYLKYLVGVILAYCFHTSSLIGLICYYTDFLRWPDLKKNQKRFLITILLATPLVIKQACSHFDKYSHYFNVANYQFGMMLLIKIAIYLFLSFIILLPNSKVNESDNCRNLNNNIIYYGIGIILTTMGYLFPYMERIGLLFYLFEGYFYGRIIRLAQNKDKVFYFIVLGIISLYYLYGDLFIGGQGQLPYQFVWESSY